ncbi:hypothetical protein IJG04_02620 [Candidatus Saccharibacteria bacterium]|nr:hypothetical protein [Candidatus Saccharibacteria bacterium]
MSEINQKLEYVSEITRDELKRFTLYDKYKDRIDGFTGMDNLDFNFVKAGVSEYVVRVTMPDGSFLFLPIYASDGQGFRYDDFKKYSTIHRPNTKQEDIAAKSREKQEKIEAQKRKEWEDEQRAKNSAFLEKAKQLAKRKSNRQKENANDEQ